MLKTFTLLLLLALASLASLAPARAQDLQVKVMAVDSLEDFQAWMQQKPPPQGVYKTLREVTSGRKVHFPIVVTGFHPPERGVLRVVADIEYVGPDGKSLAMMKQCCGFTVTDRPDVRWAVLGPTPNLELDAGDKLGTYTIRATVSDGTRSVAASSEITLVSTAGATKPQSPPAAPRLQMAPPPAKNPGRDADKRDCLSLPTPAEVIKCAEKK
jgi:hypothetical protein